MVSDPPVRWYLLVLTFLAGVAGLASAYTVAEWIVFVGPMLQTWLGGGV